MYLYLYSYIKSAGSNRTSTGKTPPQKGGMRSCILMFLQYIQSRSSQPSVSCAYAYSLPHCQGSDSSYRHYPIARPRRAITRFPIVESQRSRQAVEEVGPVSTRLSLDPTKKNDTIIEQGSDRDSHLPSSSFSHYFDPFESIRTPSSHRTVIYRLLANVRLVPVHSPPRGQPAFRAEAT